jgi:hypothetical protein
MVVVVARVELEQAAIKTTAKRRVVGAQRQPDVPVMRRG